VSTKSNLAAWRNKQRTLSAQNAKQVPTLNIKDRIAALRSAMKKHGIAAYLIPSSDEHADEYLPAFWLRREFMSGFSGSAGDLVVTLKSAALWTDGRYFLQAERQLKNSGIVLMRAGQPDTPMMSAWIAAQVGKNGKAGVDPGVCTMLQFTRLSSMLSELNCTLLPVEPNLVDQIWKEQPQDPGSKITLQSEKFAGESAAAKLKRLRAALKTEGAAAHVIAGLDAIAWLFNLRGTDIECNPFVISYAIIEQKTATFFVDPRKLTPPVKTALAKHARVLPYAEFWSALRALDKRRVSVWIDPAFTSQKIAIVLAKNSKISSKDSPITLMKAAKNAVELKGMRDCHVRDGAAVVKFLFWLSNTIGKTKITEVSAGEKIETLRALDPLYRGASFDTIAGYGPNSAVIHYRAEPKTALTLKKRGLFLLDSGGQYLDGTTDITRTVALSKPTPEQKEMFTRVLKGMIALQLVRFPKGTKDRELDSLARSQIWAGGQDYNHGTGHGVGAYMSVHEGPQRINPFRDGLVPLVPGMVLSDEPGYYKPGAYGIRIENLVYVAPDKEFSKNGRIFYKFENLTFCPIDQTLINRALLTKDELNWLNQYHQQVKKKLSKLLSPTERKWLEKATRKI
jgi:Xaa-Pro aminopeptidase